MGLSLTYEQCVRTRSRLLDCRVCVEACPTGAIALDGGAITGAITVRLDDCIECGLCHGACPTEAFAAPFDEDAALAAGGGRLACGEGGLPCVAALATEVIVTLGLRHDGAQIEAVAGCPSAAGHPALVERVAEANRMLAALGRPPVALCAREAAPEAPAGASVGEPSGGSGEAHGGRRRFLRALVGAERPAGKGTLRRPSRIDRSQMQRVPPRRHRLQTALAETALAETALAETAPVAPLVGDLSFTSDKRLDPETCTVCTICVSICPTGALQAGRGWRSIAFDASVCVKCRLCHAVCAPEALTLAPAPDLPTVLSPGHRVLGALPTRSCKDCGRRYHRSEGRDGLCATCADLEDEAFELTGLR